MSGYAYDALNRIASFSNGSVTEAYSYDAAGNIIYAGGFQSIIRLEFHYRGLRIGAEITIDAVLAEVVTKLLETGLHLLYVISADALTEFSFP